MKLRDRLTVERASLDWAQGLVTERHYLHRPVHSQADPFAYAIALDGQVVGTIIMATPHFTKQKRLFGYPGLPTKWQTLVLSRLWLDPAVQGGVVTDRQGQGHAPAGASCALGKLLKRVQRDWLDHHPVRFPDQPYHVRLILAYADTGQGHEGIIYQAANFKRWGETKNTRPRHSTRGQQDGSPKILYVYELPEPRWQPPLQLQLPFQWQLMEVP